MSGLFRVSGGTRTQLADITGTIAAGTTYGVRIERVGAAIRVFRSGALVAQATDATFTGGGWASAPATTGGASTT